MYCTGYCAMVKQTTTTRLQGLAAAVWQPEHLTQLGCELELCACMRACVHEFSYINAVPLAIMINS